MSFYRLIILAAVLTTISCSNNETQVLSENISQDELVVEPESWDSITNDSTAIFYIQFLKSEYLNKVQTIKTEFGKEEIIYLGCIKNKNGDVISHVIRVYTEVQAAIQIHGHSNVVFIHKNNNLVKRFDLGLPEELPFKLENNNLYFNYSDDSKKEKIHVDTIGTRLPKFICVEPDNCY